MDDGAIIDLGELIRNLDRLPDILQAGLVQAMDASCLKIEEDAKSQCPLGHNGGAGLAGSITHDVNADDKEVDGRVGSVVPYAPFVHNGTGIYAKDGLGRQTPWHYQDEEGNWHTTRGMEPTPFLQDASDKNRSDITELFKGVLDDYNSLG